MSETFDRWADWILRYGFVQGQSLERARAMASGRLGNGKVMLDRILADGTVAPDANVLDVGTGVGQLALEARTRVGAGGRVVGIDISRDALRLCSQEAAMQTGSLAPVWLVAGDGVTLPFRPGSFDHVLTRSVLIYIRDKAAAAREFHRVLRPGGRVSLFEPINRASETEPWNLGLADVSELQPEHDRVVQWLRGAELFRDEMCGFDERDLVELFVHAGFESVALRYEYKRWVVAPATHAQLTGVLLESRPNPGSPSMAEAARAVLGGGADKYLGKFAALRDRCPAVMSGAIAILNAVRAR